MRGVVVETGLGANRARPRVSGRGGHGRERLLPLQRLRTAHVLGDLGVQVPQHLLHGIRLAVAHRRDVGLGDLEPELLEGALVQRVPVVDLLLRRVRRAEVVQVDVLLGGSVDAEFGGVVVAAAVLPQPAEIGKKQSQ